MASAKERMLEIINAQPDGCSYDEILRELVLARIAQRGALTAAENRIASHGGDGEKSAIQRQE